VIPCGWEGNLRSGVALTMRHRLRWFIHLRVYGIRNRNELRVHYLCIGYICADKKQMLIDLTLWD